MQGHKINWGRAVPLVIGIGLVVVALLAELRSGASAGLGPYQWLMIGAGIGFLLTSISQRETIMRLGIIWLSVVITLAMLEFGAMLLVRSDLLPDPQIRPITEDALLMSVAVPDTPDYDANGWRNAQALSEADIVVIGDSQTWGFNATLDETWWSVMGQQLDQTVYSLALGGYGTIQYQQLIPDALALNPQTIVIGNYAGNDLYDAYRVVYGLDFYADQRRLADDPETSQQFRREINNTQEALLRVEEQLHDRYFTPTWGETLQSQTYLGQLLSAQGLFPDALLARPTLNDAFEQIAAEVETLDQRMPIYLGDDTLTLMAPRYRLYGLDQRDARIQEGMRLTQEALLQMQAQTAAAGVDVLMLIIPTKEMIYADAIESQYGELSEDYQQLIAGERWYRDALMSLFEANDIAYVDALPPLRAAALDETLFPPSSDSHYLPAGYRIIGEAVAAHLQRESD